MNLLPSPGPLRAFRKSAWEFQATFVTPLGQLPQFVQGILGSGKQPFDAATLEIAQVVFEPKNLRALATRHSLAIAGGFPRVLEASGALEVEELLTAALGDCVDFLLVPSPRPFVVYADHDEYTTLLAHRRQGLTKVVEALSGRFKEVPDFRLEF